MTQSRVEYESMTPQGTDEGLDLWEAFRLLVYCTMCLMLSYLFKPQELPQSKHIVPIMRNCFFT